MEPDVVSAALVSNPNPALDPLVAPRLTAPPPALTSEAVPIISAPKPDVEAPLRVRLPAEAVNEVPVANCSPLPLAEVPASETVPRVETALPDWKARPASVELVPETLTTPAPSL